MSSILRAKSTTGGNKRLTVAKEGKHYSVTKARPVDELSERYNQFKHVIQALIGVYEDARDQAIHSAKETSKQATAIPVPFQEADLFLPGDNGLQNAFYVLQNHLRTISEIHSQFSTAIEAQVLSVLNLGRGELKDHTDAIDRELGELSDIVDKERDTSTAVIADYSKSIALTESARGHSAVTFKSDPFITHQLTRRQLTNQLEAENRLTRLTIQFQFASEQLEKKLVECMHTAADKFQALKEASDKKLAPEWIAIQQCLTAVGPKAEWDHFVSLEGNRLLDPQTPMRDPNFITFPGQHHASSKPIKEGILHRKKRFTKNYREYHLVLTPSGFLHQYRPQGYRGKVPSEMYPNLSLFIPDLTLGPPSAPHDKKHKFYLTGPRYAAVGKDSSRGLSLGLNKSKEVAYTFKASSHWEMRAWWEAIQSLARMTLDVVSSNDRNSTRSTFYPSSVSNVGLPSSSATDSSSGAWTVNDGTSTFSRDGDGSILSSSHLSFAQTTPTISTLPELVEEDEDRTTEAEDRPEDGDLSSTIRLYTSASPDLSHHARLEGPDSETESFGGSSVEEEQRANGIIHPTEVISSTLNGGPVRAHVSPSSPHDTGPPSYSGMVIDYPTDKKLNGHVDADTVVHDDTLAAGPVHEAID